MRSHFRHQTLGIGLVALVAFSWAWLASGPWLVMGLNWDTSSYMAAYASGQGSWRDLPWNSHFGLGPIYGFGYALSKPLGGSQIDGARLMGALAFAVAGAAVAWIAQRLCGKLGLLWAGVYVSAWGVAHLLLTVEDNILYLPAATGLVALALARCDGWHWRDGVVAGVLGAAGALVSWQAGLYVFAPVYVALVLGGAQRSVRTRVLDVLVIVAALLATLHLYLLLFQLAGSVNTFGELWRTLFSRPEPSFFPHSWRELVALLSHPRQVLRHIGLGVVSVLGPDMGRAGWVQRSLPLMGLSLLLALLLATAAATLRARRTGRWQLQITLALSFALLLATALYIDLPVDKYKRYEFLPLMVCLVGAAACNEWGIVTGPKKLSAAVLATLVVIQFGWAGYWAHHHRAALAQTEPQGYHGRLGMPWFVYFRSIRHANPQACRFVFPLDAELGHGRYQLEIPAGLWSELPDHVLVGDPAQTQLWPRQVKVLAPQDLGPPLDCEWRAPGL